MGAEGALETIRFCQQQINYWSAQQVRALAEFTRLREGDEFSSDEIAPFMRWTSNHAVNRLVESQRLVEVLPQTVDALERGEIDLYKAKIIHDATVPLTAEQAAKVEEQVLDKAPEQTSTQLRGRLRRTVFKVDPEGVRERIAAKKAERAAGMEVSEEGDDMAQLWVYLPADKAVACAHRIDKIARSAKGPDDDRTLNQRRADSVADLLLTAPDGASTVKVHLYVTVSAATLMGLNEDPAELAGYGPISADLARELSGDATWHRLLTDPTSGQLMDFGTATYRPPARLRQYLWARDKTCRFPGCMTRAQRCEIDHTKPFPKGKTSACNCGPYCKRHHRLKHESDWIITQPIPGRFVAKSPAGKIYVRDQEPVLV